jgi:O-antigen/teichoic acid export membrane protein
MSDTNDPVLQTVLGSGSVLFVGLAVQLLVNFGTRVVLARLLGQIDYGAVSLGVALMLTVSIVSLVGTDNGVGRYLPRYDTPSKRGAVVQAGLELTLPIAIILSVGAAVLSPFLAKYVFSDPSVSPVLRVFSLSVPFLVVLKYFIGTVRGMKRTLPRIYMESFGIPILRFVFVVAALVAGFSVFGVSVAYVSAYVVVALVALVFLVRRTPLRQAERDRGIRREMFTFSAPLMVVATINMFFSNIDTLLIGYFSSVGDVGVYNVVYPLASLLTTALTAFGFLFMPAVSEHDVENDVNEIRQAYQALSKWIVFLTLPAFLIFVTFPERVIGLTFGSSYTQGGLALVVLAVGFLMHAMGGPTGNILTALGRTRFIMKANLSVLLLNIILNLVLIPRYSIVGAATATMVGYALMNGLYIGALYYESKLQPFSHQFFHVCVVGTVTWVGFTIVVWQLRPGTNLFVSLYTLFLFVYTIAVLSVADVEPEVISLVDNIESRVGLNLAPVKQFLKYFAD